MTALKIIILVFILFASSRAFLRFKDKSLTKKGIVFWFCIWSALLIFVFYPGLSNMIASFLGMGRGIDSLFFLSIILLFYSVFRLYVKIDKVDKNLTELAINISKELHKNK